MRLILGTASGALAQLVMLYLILDRGQRDPSADVLHPIAALVLMALALPAGIAISIGVVNRTRGVPALLVWIACVTQAIALPGLIACGLTRLG